VRYRSPHARLAKQNVVIGVRVKRRIAVVGFRSEAGGIIAKKSAPTVLEIQLICSCVSIALWPLQGADASEVIGDLEPISFYGLNFL
jgi:hypothetical protein